MQGDAAAMHKRMRTASHRSRVSRLLDSALQRASWRAGHPTQSAGRVASLMNSLLRCRSGLVRHAPQRRTGVAGRVTHRHPKA